MEILIELKTSVKLKLLNSAIFFLHECKKIENDPSISQTDITGDNKTKHFAYSSAVIIYSCAFVETALNDLIFELINIPDNKKISHLKNGEKIENLKRCVNEKPYIYNQQINIRINRILKIYEVKIYEESDEIFHNLWLLNRIRNRLIHYESEYYNLDRDNPYSNHSTDLEHKLNGLFKPNQLAHSSRPFFPDKCIGFGCGKWSILSAITIMEDFYSKLCIELVNPLPNFEEVKKI